MKTLEQIEAAQLRAMMRAHAMQFRANVAPECFPQGWRYRTFAKQVELAASYLKLAVDYREMGKALR